MNITDDRQTDTRMDEWQHIAKHSRLLKISLVSNNDLWQFLWYKAPAGSSNQINEGIQAFLLPALNHNTSLAYM